MCFHIRPGLIAISLLLVVACSDHATVSAPKLASHTLPSAEQAVVTPGNGLTLSVMYPPYVMGTYTTTWSAQVSGGTPPYSFYWDATACPAPDGRSFVQFSETEAQTSVFELTADACTMAYRVNLYVADASGRSVSWQRIYRYNTTYYPLGPLEGCTIGGIMNCIPGLQQ